MKDGEFWHLKHVSDAGLRRDLGVLLASDAWTEARIVAHLAEVDRRKLYSRDGYSCLFNYCQGQLGLSESQAFHRMTAARLARHFPVVFEMIEQRRIHLSGLVELRDFLGPDNHRELLESAAGKSKRQIKELLAARFPGEAMPDAVRKLPAGRIAPLIAPATLRNEQAPKPVEATPPPSLSQEGVAVPLFDPVTGEVFSRADETEAKAGQMAPPQGAPITPPDIRYRIQFDAGSALKAKLELARALSSHSNPRGDLETLFERALDAYVEQLQKRRFAQVRRPRVKVAKSEPSTTSGTEASADANARSVRQLERTRTRMLGRRSEQRAHLSHETRRAVVEQSGMRCSFVAPNGKRCDEQAFLQFHHEHPWSRHGSDAAENLALRCASHNRLLAEQDFGSRHVEQRTAEARAAARRRREESGG